MPPSPSEQFMQFVLGKWISKPIYVAAVLGIADLLADGPLPIDVLAEKCDAHPASLYRLLRSLAAVGIFKEISDRSFTLTPMAECLQSGRLRSAAVMFHSAWHDQAWDQLLSAVKSGKAAFEIAHGAPAYRWFESNPAAAAQFQAANASKADRMHAAVVAAHDFASAVSIADIGGGHGRMLIQILGHHPHLEGLVYDLPEGIQAAEKAVAASAVAHRCQVLAGDFFDEIPGGFQVYLLANVLHNWDDARCRRILANCFEAMAPGSELLVIEALIPDGNTFSIAKLLDIEGMVMGGGQERTDQQYRQLLTESGFAEIGVEPMADGNALIAVTKA